MQVFTQPCWKHVDDGKNAPGRIFWADRFGRRYCFACRSPAESQAVAWFAVIKPEGGGSGVWVEKSYATHVEACGEATGRLLNGWLPEEMTDEYLNDDFRLLSDG